VTGNDLDLVPIEGTCLRHSECSSTARSEGFFCRTRCCRRIANSVGARASRWKSRGGMRGEKVSSP